MKTIGNIIRWHRLRHPDANAVIDQHRRATYREVDEGSNCFANALIGADVAKGERIAVLDKAHYSLLEACFGVVKAGAVFTPINWRLSPAEMAFVIEDAQARVLLVGPEFAEAVQSIESDLKQLTHIIYFGDNPPSSNWKSYSDFRGNNTVDPKRDAGEHDAAFQLYTSGTTGLPKGAELTNHNICELGNTCFFSFSGFEEGDIVLCCMPMYHIAGIGYAVAMFLTGTRLYLLAEADPTQILEVIQKEDINFTFLVPALINFMLAHPKCKDTDFSKIKGIGYGASPMPEPLLKAAMAAFKCNFIQAYGLTETTGGICVLSPDDHRRGGKLLRSAGQPVFGQEVRIVDAEGKEMPLGEVGEIVTRGSLVMNGYWRREEATAKAIRDGWFHSGDAGYMDEEGYVYIHDRVKDMIISGGENVYPAEVENVLFQHPAVADAAVIGVPDAKWGETVKAVVVAKADADEDPADIINFCRDKIAHFKCPTSVDYIEILPRNPSGKVLKRVLREPYWEGKERQVN